MPVKIHHGTCVPINKPCIEYKLQCQYEFHDVTAHIIECVQMLDWLRICFHRSIPIAKCFDLVCWIFPGKPNVELVYKTGVFHFIS